MKNINAKTDSVFLEFYDSLAVITLNEPESRNSFTASLIDGMNNAFAALKEKSDIKVVLMMSNGHFFSSGGTKEELLNFNRGQKSFAADLFFQELWNCEIPIIAAIQGHALGGGLVLGLYADIVVFSERSRYAANFMSYGFTPGMGATWLLPKKFGPTLGEEMLWTAQWYSGKALQERGANVLIVPHNQVSKISRQYCDQLALHSLASLKLLKQNFIQKHKSMLNDAISKELDMHKECITGTDVKQRIEELYQ